MTDETPTSEQPHPITPTLEHETAFWHAGLRRVAGIDEAGRGPWAGPVFAAAVILPPDAEVLASLEGVRDSKLLSARRRAALVPHIEEIALAVGVGVATVEEIDALRIVPATRLAMQRAVAALTLAPDALLIDGLRLPEVALPQSAFPRADVYALSVAAASIIAKEARDRWMVEVAEVEYPGYGFAQHKGYGTRAHRDALNRLGVCPIHRRSFQPVAARVLLGEA